MKKLLSSAIAIAAITCLCAATSWAQPQITDAAQQLSETIMVPVSRFNCGNGQIDQGEVCDPGVAPENWPCNTPSMGAYFPPTGQSIACNPDTCQCLPRGCNDGIFEPATEECDQKSIEQAVLPLYPTPQEWNSMTQEEQQALAKQIVTFILTTMEEQCKQGTRGGAIQPEATLILCTENCMCRWCGDGMLAEPEECSTSSVPGVDDLLFSPLVPVGVPKSCDPNFECADCFCSPIPEVCNYNNIADLPTEQCDGTDPGKCDQLAQPDEVFDVCSHCKCKFRRIIAVCGNGIIDTGEQCDGTNQGSCDPTNSDGYPYVGCSSTCTCQYGYCGDYKLNGPNEECDHVDQDKIDWQCVDAGFDPISGYACNNCKCEKCGNGRLEGTEQCERPGDPCPGSSLICSLSCTCEPDTGGICGDGVLDPGEECDGTQFNNTICPTVKVSGGLVLGLEGCLADCTCTYRPRREPGDLCGNGVWDNGEQCDASEQPQNPKQCRGHPELCVDCQCVECGDGILQATEMCEPTLPPEKWLCPPPENVAIPIGDYYDCINCLCTPKEGVCGDGKLDPGEECEAGIPCPGEAICTIDCRCEDVPPPDCPPQCPPDCDDCCETPPVDIAKACSVRIVGASTKAQKDVLDNMNEPFKDLFDDTPLKGNDVVGEAAYSMAEIIVTLGGTAAKAQVADAIKLGDYSVGAASLVQVSGPPPEEYLLREGGFKPPMKFFVKNPTRIFPIAEADFAGLSGKAAGLKNVLMPDLSAGLGGLGLGAGVPITIDNVVNVLGSENVSIQAASSTSWKLNNVISMEMVPSVGKAVNGEGATTFIIKVAFQPDIASWTGVEGGPQVPEGMRIEDFYIENRLFDLVKAVQHVKDQITIKEAAGQPVDCSVMLGIPWEENQNYQYVVVQNKLETANNAGTLAEGMGFLSIPSGLGYGAGGCRCDMAAALPTASQFALYIGIAATGLGSIVALRRRKRK